MKRWFEKLANELTAETRDSIKTKNFAIPKGRRYPIENEAHARNALARVDQHGSPGEKHQVYAAVAKKYPGLAARSSVPGVKKELAKDKQGCGSLKMSAMRHELAALYNTKQAEELSGRKGAWEAFKGEAPSALGATAGAVGAGYLGINPLVGAGMGYGVGSIPEAYKGVKEYMARRAAKGGR
jgi:ribosome assembly protein YihI (activator of Der GTPase)